MATTQLPPAVLEVERFIDANRIDRDDGRVVWRRTPTDEGSPPHSLYHGSAGIVLFYLELHRATGETRHLDRAVAGGDELLAYLQGRERLTVGFGSGWPGYVFVLEQLGEATGADRFRAGARKALESMMAQSEPLGAGIGWIEPMPFSDITGLTGDREVLDLSIGAAGAGLVLLHAHRVGLDDRALGWARQTADRLLEMSIETEHGPTWLMMADMPFSFTAPNFAHGAAGVGHFLAELHRETGDRVYLDTAIAAARHVQRRGVVQANGGVLVRHTEEQEPPIFYLGVCHGPAGTGRLMYLLHRITGDAEWLDWVHANMQGLLGTGAPEARSEGLWQNHGQCCGDVGIGDFALWLHRATGRADYLELARRIEAEVLRRGKVEHGARSWQQAEHRDRPRFVETQTGYMQGAAGIGSFLLHLATIERARPAKIALPDTPFE